MGVSGCGKSTLGTVLAKALDCAFLEGDAFHSVEAVEKMRAGQALSDADRWPWLDRLGEAAAKAVSERGRVVVACSALKVVYRDRLRAAIGAPVRFALLQASREKLYARMKNRPGHYMPASLLDSQLATLEYPLDRENALVLDSEESLEILRDRVLTAFRGH
ncbi:gluconokinase [Novosphingobium sp. BL-8A]|uniref:gluconokinase n=1 Tax=Novosphingobium sp. BL-8A TaxID=3127639 RepID=UPI003756B939